MLVCPSCGRLHSDSADESSDNDISAAQTERLYFYPHRLTLIRGLFELTRLPLNDEYFVDGAREYKTELINACSEVQQMTAAELAEIMTVKLDEREALTLASGELPRIYITTEQGEITGEYGDASVAIVTSDTPLSDCRIDGCEIRVRGTSTAEAPKKPYTFRYDDPVSLLGMDAGRRWVLLANAFDKTQLRNKIALDLAAKLRLPYVSQSEFVSVWVDGVEMGLYLLCEPVTEGKRRVDIDTDAGDCLLELSTSRHIEGKRFIKTEGGVPLYFTDPEQPSDELYDDVKARFDAVETALGTRTPEYYDDFIDVDSFVDFYIFMELVKDVDGYFASTFFFFKDGLLYAGPPWDFDLSMGNVSAELKDEKYRSYSNVRGSGDESGDSARGAWMQEGWFAELWRDDDFRRLVYDRWLELRPLVENLYAENELGISAVDELTLLYGDDCAADYRADGDYSSEARVDAYETSADEDESSFADNITNTIIDIFRADGDDRAGGWSLSEPYSKYELSLGVDATLDDYTDHLKSWLEARAEWLDQYFTEAVK